MNLLTTLVSGCICPEEELDTITPANCREAIGQIQRYFFVKGGQLIWDIADPLLNIPATIQVLDYTIDKVAPWNVLYAASGFTKVVMTPLVGGDTTLLNGGAITNGGGDNSTLNGETQTNGFNPTSGAARFDNLDKTEVKAIRKLLCSPDLEVYMVNQFGKILVREEDGKYTGFPVKNVTLLSKDNNGFGTRDANAFTFQIDSDYDEYLTFVKPDDFNALQINA